eukprot:TRINITY_DN38218_c0_g1_i1.p1 TRINITY_DN38218_c0_g1~~TRINITY_DN38218_c0_g1_i1.p1  ORF type:complete len:859 (+),score=162.01 TRINITY_DN38218_c0_g1_i1:60-2579(+)
MAVRSSIAIAEPRFIHCGPAPGHAPSATVYGGTCAPPSGPVHPVRMQPVRRTNTARSSSPKTTYVSNCMLRPVLLGCPSPSSTRFQQVERGDFERKALQQALAESQASVRAEARRAGAAEALLRERTAALSTAAHQAASREATKKLRSNSSSSASVGSELQVELQCAMSVRDRLVEKLTLAERESASLRHSEDALRLKVQSSASEAERYRSEFSEGQRRCCQLQEELEVSNTLRETEAEKASAKLLAREAELAQVGERLEDMQRELTTTRALLASKSAEVDQLLREKREAEELRCSLDAACEDLNRKVSELEEAAQERRALEVSFDAYKGHHGLSEQQQLRKIAELQVMVDRLSRDIASTEMKLGAQQGNTAELESSNVSLRQQLAAAEVQRVELHNTVQEMKGNIRVVCRVKPHTDDEKLALTIPKPNKVSLNHGIDVYGLSFDKVFGPDAAQEDVYGEVAGMVQSALDGYKVCIFAYGQTGSGKTFTMQGTDQPGNAGLIPRSLLTIFQTTEEMRTRGWCWSLQTSFMEVYNETFRDLLRGSAAGAGDVSAGVAGGAAAATSLDGHHVVTQHDSWGAVVTGMTRVDVESVEHINSLMARAARHRAVGATDMNASSSRSHFIFALYLRGTNEALGQEVTGVLHLVDLAGSERLEKSGSTGERLKETRSINRSLSSLADVFAAKAECSSHVPFRNSKLTHLMEPCLSGQGKTLMLVSVQAEQGNAHETLCSLRFAKQVSQCTTGGRPQRNVKSIPSGMTPRTRNSVSPPASARTKPTAGKLQRSSMGNINDRRPIRRSPSGEGASRRSSEGLLGGERRFSAPIGEAISSHVITLWSESG